MTPTVVRARVPEAIPEAIPVEVDPPRIFTVPPRAAEPAPEEGGVGLRPLECLRYRWATVVFLGGFLASVLGFTAYSLIPAKYTTYSIIRVAPQDPRIYYNDDPHGRGDFASYLKTQANMLRSHFVLAAAIRDPEVAALPMLRAQEDPVRFLEDELQVEVADGSELIKPKLSGDDPRAITMIINAVHDAYFKEVVEGERARKQIRLKQIEDSIAKRKQDLERFAPAKPAQADDQPAESLPGVGPSLAAGEMTRLRGKLSAADVRQKELEDQKARLARRKENPAGELPPIPPGFAAQFDSDPAIVGLNKQVALCQGRMNYLLEVSGDRNNPGVKELQKKIAEATQERERVRKERVEEFQKTQILEVARRLQAEEEKIEVELASVRLVQEKTNAELKEYEAKLPKLLPDGDVPTDFHKVDTKIRSEIIAGLMDRSSLLQLELNAPNRVESRQKAAIPMKREMKKQLLGTAAAAFIGFALVGLGVVGYESRVRRTMSVADVQKATLSPILGAVPAVRTVTGQPTPELAMAEEAIEKVRANLMQQFGKAGPKVVLVTSALADEGRTFLARELALSFARAGGQTLLVDFDLRNPTLHEAFDVPNPTGFCELLTGETDPPTAIQHPPHGIALLSAGRWSDVVRQYLSPERIDSALIELRARYDYVVVSAHPVLTVAETALSVRAADAVVLTVEKYESRVPLVARAQEKIAALAPEAFGIVVVNASRDESLQ